MGNGKEEFRRAISKRLSLKQDKQVLIPGLLGALVGNTQRVTVPNRKGFVYVRVHASDSEIVEAFNDTVSPVYGLAVVLTRDELTPQYYRVIRRDIPKYQSWGDGIYFPLHGHTHSFIGSGTSGRDITWVQKKQFVPLGISPESSTGSFILNLIPDFYMWNGEQRYFTGSVTADLSALRPASPLWGRFVTIYINSENTFGYLTGSSFVHSPWPSTWMSYVPIVSGSMGVPLASVLLTHEATRLDWPQIYDARSFLSNGGYDAIRQMGVVKTVGVGKDYATIQDAIDFFDTKVTLDCEISISTGTYTEALSIDGHVALNVNSLRLVGDTRDIAAHSFVDGSAINNLSIPNLGAGTCSLYATGSSVVVYGSTTNPDFLAAGLVGGDKIIIWGNSGNPTEYTIQSVSGNSLNLTGAAPAVGNTDTVVTICPNRIITSDLYATLVLVMQDTYFKGLWIKQEYVSAGGATAVSVRAGGFAYEHCLITVQGASAASVSLAVTSDGSAYASDFSNNTYNYKHSTVIQFGAMVTSTVGFQSVSNKLTNRYCYALNFGYGFYLRGLAWMTLNSSMAVRCNYGLYTTQQSMAVCTAFSALQAATVGIYSAYKSWNNALSTSAYNTSATPYSPAVSDTEGNVFAVNTFS